jgi:hypothetical protein
VPGPLTSLDNLAFVGTLAGGGGCFEGGGNTVLLSPWLNNVLMGREGVGRKGAGPGRGRGLGCFEDRMSGFTAAYMGKTGGTDRLTDQGRAGLIKNDTIDLGQQLCNLTGLAAAGRKASLTPIYARILCSVLDLGSLTLSALPYSVSPRAGAGAHEGGLHESFPRVRRRVPIIPVVSVTLVSQSRPQDIFICISVYSIRGREPLQDSI